MHSDKSRQILSKCIKRFNYGNKLFELLDYSVDLTRRSDFDADYSVHLTRRSDFDTEFSVHLTRHSDFDWGLLSLPDQVIGLTASVND